MDTFLKQEDQKAFEQKKAEGQQAKAEAFLKDYRDVCDKHRLELVARMKYSDTGAAAILGVVELKKEDPTPTE